MGKALRSRVRKRGAVIDRKHGRAWALFGSSAAYKKGMIDWKKTGKYVGSSSIVRTGGIVCEVPVEQAEAILKAQETIRKMTTKKGSQWKM